MPADRQKRTPPQPAAHTKPRPANPCAGRADTPRTRPQGEAPCLPRRRHQPRPPGRGGQVRARTARLWAPTSRSAGALYMQPQRRSAQRRTPPTFQHARKASSWVAAPSARTPSCSTPRRARSPRRVRSTTTYPAACSCAFRCQSASRTQRAPRPLASVRRSLCTTERFDGVNALFGDLRAAATEDGHLACSSERSQACMGVRACCAHRRTAHPSRLRLLNVRASYTALASCALRLAHVRTPQMPCRLRWSELVARTCRPWKARCTAGRESVTSQRPCVCVVFLGACVAESSCMQR